MKLFFGNQTDDSENSYRRYMVHCSCGKFYQEVPVLAVSEQDAEERANDILQDNGLNTEWIEFCAYEHFEPEEPEWDEDGWSVQIGIPGASGVWVNKIHISEWMKQKAEIDSWWNDIERGE